MVNRLRDGSVVIVEEDKEGWKLRCGGVWIDGGRFLTARHCVAEDEEKAKPGLMVRFKVREEINVNRLRDGSVVIVEEDKEGWKLRCGGLYRDWETDRKSVV